MATKGPRICGCGHVVKYGVRCACAEKRDRERKAEFDRTRPSSSARGYGSKWEEYRAHFLRKFPTCARCGAPSVVVDHIRPAKGDMRLFWDRLNHQALCAHCHNSHKQSLERRGNS